ncbi:MAG: hypothetical protein V9E89_16795 [Ilumatobacteraceae bacterium]
MLIGLPVSSPDGAAVAAFLNEATGGWEIVGGAFDPATSRVYVSTNHLSIWQAFRLDGWQLLTSIRDVVVTDVLGLGDRGEPPQCDGSPLPVVVTALQTPGGGASGEVFKLDSVRAGRADWRVPDQDREPTAGRRPPEGKRPQRSSRVGHAARRW